MIGFLLLLSHAGSYGTQLLPVEGAGRPQPDVRPSGPRKIHMPALGERLLI